MMILKTLYLLFSLVAVAYGSTLDEPNNDAEQQQVSRFVRRSNAHETNSAIHTLTHQ